jgi:hypothetical protein
MPPAPSIHATDPNVSCALEYLQQFGLSVLGRPELLDPDPIALPSITHLPEMEETVAVSHQRRAIGVSFQQPLHQTVLPAHAKSPAYGFEYAFFHQATQQLLQRVELTSN